MRDKKTKIEVGYCRMHISSSKLFTIVILLCINVINFLGAELSRFNPIVLNLLQIELFIIYIFVLYVSIKRYGVYSIKTGFLLTLTLFSLNAVFFTVFGLTDFGDTALGIQYFTWETKTKMVIIEYYILFLSVFYSIALSDKVETKENKPLLELYPNDKAILLWARRAFYFTYSFAILYSIKYALAVLNIGYVASFQNGVTMTGPVNFVLKVLYNIFILSFYLICSSEEDGKKFDKCGLLYISCMAIHFMQGSRAAAIIPILFVLIFRYEVYRKKFNTVAIGIFAVLLIIAMQAMTFIRVGTTFDYGGLPDTIFNFLKTTASSLNIAGYYYQYRDLLNINNLPYALEPIVRVVSIVLFPDIMAKGQNLEMVKMRASLNHQITYSLSEEYYLSGAGVGSNFIAEMSEFYFPGVLIGSIIFSLWIVFVSKKIRTSRFIRYFSALFINQILFAPRAEMLFDSYTFVKWAFFYVAAVWLLTGKIHLKRGIHGVMEGGKLDNAVGGTYG